MRVTSLTDERSSPEPVALDLHHGAFADYLAAAHASRIGAPLPGNLHGWPDAICAGAVRALCAQLRQVPIADRFFEASRQYVHHLGPLAEDAPWSVILGSLRVLLMVGRTDPVRPQLGQPDDTIPAHKAITIQVEPEPDDPKFSSNPDVAQSQILRHLRERTPEVEPPAPDNPAPLLAALDDAGLAWAARQCQKVGMKAHQGLMAAGIALLIDETLAAWQATSAEVSFEKMEGDRSALLAVERQAVPVTPAAAAHRWPTPS